MIDLIADGDEERGVSSGVRTPAWLDESKDTSHWVDRQVRISEDYWVNEV
jgi:hypothetical protein